MSLKNSCNYSKDNSVINGLSYISGRNVSFAYGNIADAPIIKGTDFEVNQGAITAIIGESGSGKSTLLRLIYGLLEPIEGEIRLKGQVIPPPREKLIPGHEDMKIVSQDFDTLNLYAKVWDNIASQISNINLEIKENKTREVLNSLKINHLSNKRVADLSGGEKQRVAIARALIHDPEVLLMDEPFNQVDAAFRSDLQADIRDIVDRTGLTVILVSHDPEEVLAMSDHIIIMKDGVVLEAAGPSEIYNRPQYAYSAKLLAKSNILDIDSAQLLGLNATKNIAIHREWIDIKAEEKSDFIINKILFRGFYHEILLNNGQISLCLITNDYGSFSIGQKVQPYIKHYHQLIAE